MMTDEELSAKREQAARWYDRQAEAAECVRRVIDAEWWRSWSSRIREGHADHRLDAMLDEQAEMDAERSAAA